LTRKNIRSADKSIQEGGKYEEIKPRNRKIICISLNPAERIKK
jgi:hypothetical protein